MPGVVVPPPKPPVPPTGAARRRARPSRPPPRRPPRRPAAASSATCSGPATLDRVVVVVDEHAVNGVADVGAGPGVEGEEGAHEHQERSREREQEPGGSQTGDVSLRGSHGKRSPPTAIGTPVKDFSPLGVFPPAVRASLHKPCRHPPRSSATLTSCASVSPSATSSLRRMNSTSSRSRPVGHEVEREHHAGREPAAQPPERQRDQAHREALVDRRRVDLLGRRPPSRPGRPSPTAGPTRRRSRRRPTAGSRRGRSRSRARAARRRRRGAGGRGTRAAMPTGTTPTAPPTRPPNQTSPDPEKRLPSRSSETSSQFWIR